MTEIAMEAKHKQAALWNTMDIAGREFFLNKGGQIFKFSDAEIQKWTKAVQPVIEHYVSRGDFTSEEIDAARKAARQ